MPEKNVICEALVLYLLVLATSIHSLGCPPSYYCLYPDDCALLHKPHGGLGGGILYRCTSRAVCCPSPKIKTRVDIPVEKTPKTENNNRSTEHRNAKLFTANCGYTDNSNTANRIDGGENAVVGDHPWMALIGFTGRDGKKMNVCGGTLINEKYVLTAAHCVELEDSVLTHVTLGEYDLERERDCSSCDPAQEVKVENVIRHRGWNFTTFHNDIALLRLKSRISENSRSIVPICLPFNTSALNITNGYIYEATGWGLTGRSAESAETLWPVLQKVDLDHTPCSICKNNPPFCPITDKQFCAQGPRNKDICKGDSGGPLTTPPKLDRRTVQLGITSFKTTDQCGSTSVPSVFTKVSSYIDWILDNVEP